MVHLGVKVTPVHLKSLDCHLINQEAGGKRIYKPNPLYLSKAGIPPGKSDASGGIGPRHIVTSTSGFSARCRPMRPIFPVEFQLMVESQGESRIWEGVVHGLGICRGGGEATMQNCFHYDKSVEHYYT